MWETCPWLTRTTVPPSLSLGASGAEEGPSTTECPSWISPCCHTGQDYGSQAIAKEVHAGHAVCQKSLETTLSHPCGFSNSSDYLKATSACPGHVGSCIPQHRHILNILLSSPSQQDKPGIPTAHVYIQSTILAGKFHYNRLK